MPGMDGWGGKDGVPNKPEPDKPEQEEISGHDSRKLANLYLHQEIAQALEPVVIGNLPYHSLSDMRWAIKKEADRIVDLLMKVRNKGLPDLPDWSDLRNDKP